MPKHAVATADASGPPREELIAEDRSTEPTLGGYLRFVGRHRRKLALTTLGGVLLGAVWLLLAGPTFSAQSLVMITPPVTSTADVLSPDQPTVDTEAGIMLSDAVVALVADATGMTSDDIRHSVLLSAPTNTRLLKVRFVASSATTAILGANAAADAYVHERIRILNKTLSRQIDGLDSARRKLMNASSTHQEGGADSRVASQSLSTLTARIDELRAIVVDPGSVQIRASAAISSAQRNAPVPLVSGAVGGFLLGCAFFSAVDSFRKQRSRSSWKLAKE